MAVVFGGGTEFDPLTTNEPAAISLLQMSVEAKSNVVSTDGKHQSAPDCDTCGRERTQGKIECKLKCKEGCRPDGLFRCLGGQWQVPGPVCVCSDADEDAEEEEEV